MWEHFNAQPNLRGFNIFVARAVLVWMPAASSHCVLDIIHLIGVVDGVVVTRVCSPGLQGLLFALWLLWPFHRQDMFPICWIISSLIHFGAVVWGIGTYSPTGRRQYSFPGAVHCGLYSVMWLSIMSMDYNTLLLALPSALPQPWQSQQLA